MVVFFDHGQKPNIKCQTKVISVAAVGEVLCSYTPRDAGAVDCGDQ